MQQRGSGVSVEFSLAWLLQPLSVKSFLDDIWAQTHHHVKRGCPDYFDGLLPGPSTVDELLELFRQEPAAVRLVRGRDKKSSDNYLLADGSLGVGGIRDDYADGYTIVLDGVEKYVRAIATVARSIEVELNFPIQVNTYITPPGETGLAPHYDDHDVLILQVQGSKVWHLYLGVDRPPREMQREKEKAVDTDGLPAPTDVRVEAGDVLYVPRGRVHSAETTTEQSIHLTVGLHAPTVLMLAMGALYSQSWRDDRLNARLPVRYLDDPDMDATLHSLMREAVESVDDSGAMADSLGLLADVLVRRGQCPPIGKISDANAIDGQTRVVKYHPLYSRVKAVEDGFALQFASLSTNVAADHEAALRFISTATEPFRVSELPGLSVRQQTDLARTLIVSGFLVRLPDE
jgi:ribosomal protein L16 Arg81 hydroxylase